MGRLSGLHIHAHVQRAVVPKREPAFWGVKLVRTHAEIGKDARQREGAVRAQELRCESKICSHQGEAGIV